MFKYYSKNILYLILALAVIYLPVSILLSKYYGYIDFWKSLKDLAAFCWMLLLIIKTPKPKIIELFNRFRYAVYAALFYLGYGLLISFINFGSVGYSKESMFKGLLLNYRIFIYLIIGILLAANNTKKWYNLVKVASMLVVLTLLGMALERIWPGFYEAIDYHEANISYMQSIDATGFLRSQGFLRGPNELGAIMSIAGLIGFGFYLFKKSKSGLMISLFALLGVVFSFSRSAFLGLLFGVVLLIIQSGKIKIKNPKNIKLLAGGLLTGLILILTTYNTKIFQNVILHNDHQTQNTTSNQARLDRYESSLQIISQNPFGLGVGSSGLAASSNQGRYSNLPENSYLQIVQETGLFGFGLFLSIIYMLLLFLYKGKTIENKILISIFGAVLIINLFIHNFADDSMAMVLWVLIGTGVVKK